MRQRLYRLLLRLYPAAFRNEYADEMSAIFDRRLRDAGPMGRVAAWLEALGDVALNATRIHAEYTVQDVRYSLRTLVRTPAFSMTAIVVSALGIGATTAAFSITDHVLIRALPFEDPDRLVRLYQDQSFRGYARVELSPANFRDWQRMATGFESMGAFSYGLLNLVGEGEPERISGAVVTSEVLPMLGVLPTLGRVFSAEEDRADASGTVVLSHGLWQERFAGDPRVLGRRIVLSDQPYIVIGVMPREFSFPERGIRLCKLVPSGLPIAERPSFDGRTLLVAVGITIATAISFGLLSALRAGRVSPSALAEGGRSGRSRRTERLRSVLVIAELTASVVLLISAGLLIRALWAVQQVHPGFETSGVLTLRTALPLPQYESSDVRARFYDRILSEVRGVPGVTHAAYISSVPMGWLRGGIWPVTMDGRKDSEVNAPTASLRVVTPGFFSALRIPLVAGRDVDERDIRDAPVVAVVSESFARAQFPGQSPLGRRFFMAFQERLIVGVVGDVRVRGLERPSEPQVYVPHQQVPDGGLVGPGMYAELLWHYSPQDLVVRSSTTASALVPAIRAIVGSIDSRLPVSDIRPLQDIVEGETAPRMVQLRVLTAFAGVALLLAGIGIYGLLTYLVSMRTREIGVRIALGAPTHHVLRLVLQQALGLAGAGALLGLVLAYAAGSAMRALLAGISPADVPAFAVAVALVALTSLVGTLAPALRALRIDPVVAIRAE